MKECDARIHFVAANVDAGRIRSLFNGHQEAGNRSMARRFRAGFP